MADDIIKEIVDRDIKAPAICEQHCDQAQPSISTLLDYEGAMPPIAKESENDVRVLILKSSIDNANTIYNLCREEERNKEKWRSHFIKFFSVLLVCTVIFLFTMIVLDGCGVIKLSTELVIGIFVKLFADILAILYFMIQYINNSRTLESFKTISHKLLDYLIQDKATGNGNEKPDKHEN